MQKMQHPIRNIIFALIAAGAIFTLGLVTALREPAPAAQAPAENAVVRQVYVSVMLDDGDKITGWKSVELPESSATALVALQAVAAQDKLTLDVDTSSSLGAFVKQVGKQKNGAGGKYWQFWVDGVQPLVASDKLQLKGGETILWTFRKSVL